MEQESTPPPTPAVAKADEQHSPAAEVVAALKRLLSFEGRACVGGTEIRFIHMGEAAEDDTGRFRARESGIFACALSGGTWRFLGRFDQFEEALEPLVERLNDAQYALIMLRAAIHDGRTALLELDKEIEADRQRLLAGVRRPKKSPP